MTLLDDYRSKFTHTNNRDRRITDRNNFFLSTFRDIPEYEQLKLAIDDSVDDAVYEGLVYSDASYKELVGEKTVIFSPNTPSEVVFSGQYIRPQRQGGTYLFTSVDKQYLDKLKGEIKFCNVMVNWIDELGKLHSVPATTPDKISREGFIGGSQIPLPTGLLEVKLPNNEETLGVDYNTRFIFGRKQAWKVTKFQDYADGVLTLICEFDELKIEDDFINNIAFNDNSFTLEIEQGDTIDGTSGSSTQLTYVVTRNDIPIQNTDVTWSVDDETVATISDTGLLTFISNGTTTVNASLNLNTNDNIVINVVDSPQDNVQFRLDNSNLNIGMRSSRSYTVSRHVNNIIDSSTPFTILDITNGNGYDFEVNNNIVTIDNTNRNDGSVVIRVSDGTITTDFEITFSWWN